jgi:hypothetical protein
VIASFDILAISEREGSKRAGGLAWCHRTIERVETLQDFWMEHGAALGPVVCFSGATADSTLPLTATLFSEFTAKAHLGRDGWSRLNNGRLFRMVCGVRVEIHGSEIKSELAVEEAMEAAHV